MLRFAPDLLTAEAGKDTDWIRILLLVGIDLQQARQQPQDVH